MPGLARREPEYFDCPNCGEPVPVGARSCPNCGSDDETGWNSEDAEYETLMLPGDSIDEGEFRRVRPSAMMIVAMIMLALATLGLVLR